MKKLYYILLVVTSLLTVVGCKHHDLYYAKHERANIRINIDWSDAGLSAAANGVTVIAYESETGDIYKQFTPFTTTNYVNVGLPVGVYDIILFNNAVSDYHNIDFLNQSHISTLIANGVKTEPIRALSKADEGKDVIANPDVIASSSIKNVVVTQDMVDYTLERPDDYETYVSKEYDVKPLRRVVNVTVKCHVVGVKYAAGAPRTFFKHFSGGYKLGLEQPDERQVIQEIVLSKIIYDEGTNKADGTIWQEFTSFGKVTEGGATYVVDAEFTLVDEKSYGVIFDVTDQIEVYMDGAIPRIDIFVELELPEAIPTGDSENSFDPDVEDWDDIIVGLPM